MKACWKREDGKEGKEKMEVRGKGTRETRERGSPPVSRAGERSALRYREGNLREQSEYLHRLLVCFFLQAKQILF